MIENPGQNGGNAFLESVNDRVLCRIAGVASFLLLAYTIEMIVQFVVLGGPPASALEAFRLLQNNKAIGLMRLDLPTIIVLPLYYVLFLGLYTSLRRVEGALALLGTLLTFVGVTLAVATPTALSLLPLSEKYAAASTEAARNQLLAAGEALLACDIWHGTGAILGSILLQAGAVLICAVMLRSSLFGKVTAYLGLIAHGLDLAHGVFGLFWPASGGVLLMIAGPLYPIWFVLIGRRLLQLASQPS